MSKIVTTAAALIGVGLLGASPTPAQQRQTQTQSPAAKPLATGACRVKEQAGGRTCTGDVPEAACAAIAREAKGSYTWTTEPCP